MKVRRIKMKKFDISLFVKNNDGVMEEDIRVKTNSLDYLQKKLYNAQFDESGAMYQKYYFKKSCLKDNKLNKFFDTFADWQIYHKVEEQTINEWVSMKKKLYDENATDEESIKAVKNFFKTHEEEHCKKLIETYAMAYIKFMSSQYMGLSFWELLEF